MSCELLQAKDLRFRVEPATLGWMDTSELLQLPLPWIGQERAQQAAQFGLAIHQRDYNLFVLGEVGTGRSTLMHQMMVEFGLQRPVPSDLCYLHNFEAPEQPRALRLTAGQGRIFRQLMVQLSKTCQLEIPKRLASPEFKSESDRIESAYKKEEETFYNTLTTFADARNFGLLREEGHLVFTLRDEKGEPMSGQKSLAFSPAKRQEVDKAEDELLVEIDRFLDISRNLEREMNEKLAELRRRQIKPMLAQTAQVVLDGLQGEHKNPLDKTLLTLGIYLVQVQQDVTDKLELFIPGDDEDVRRAALEVLLARFRVNLVVDNHGLTGAPVIVENNPLYHALLGGIDYTAVEDALKADHGSIRSGSLLRAHGGFLMLHFSDLLVHEHVWEKVRRFLRTGRIQIEEPELATAGIPAVSLRPEPVDVDVKIVLIGSIAEYYALQEADPETAGRFRCKVDFVDDFKATSQTRHAFSIFVAHACRRMGLLHFSADAVALLIEESHREAEDQFRQSAIFATTEALVIESNAIAEARDAKLVEARDVVQAKQARMHRHNLPEEQLQSEIVDGERLLAVTGERVAQVNGLTVIDLGDYQFGFPIRVTACTHAGEDGLLNIEREVKLSGPIHDKGVLILQSYVSVLLSHIAPLSFNASVVFEQEYSGVEGDSASCAEFYALLSSLSGLPVKQGIAVTGAINQHGEMLPVGGINEKIEGYFRSCQLLGLDGLQGVLIPSRNQRHLMLSPDVLDAVDKGQFHIHTAADASEGMSLLTGVEFGSLVNQQFPAHSVMGRVQKTLEQYRRACEKPAHTQAGDV